MNIKNRLLWIFATYGLTEFIGIPVVGSLLATLLRGLAWTAENTAEYIEYNSLADANRGIRQYTAHGAQVENMYPRGDGTVGVRFNTSDYLEQ